MRVCVRVWRREGLQSGNVSAQPPPPFDISHLISSHLTAVAAHRFAGRGGRGGRAVLGRADGVDHLLGRLELDVPAGLVITMVCGGWLLGG